MVRFEPGKLVIEIATPEPFTEYVNLLRALYLSGSFAADHSQKDPTGLDAFSVLAYSLGRSLAQFSPEDAQQIEKLLTK